MAAERGVSQVVSQLWNGNEVSDDLYEAAFNEMMAGDADDAVVAALLALLMARNAEAQALPLLVTAMRQVMRPFAAHDVIDNCGTGGDGKGSFNISTAAALLGAAMGMKVVKHGNRAVSSRAGSADVLEKLGANIEAEASVMQKSLRECGFCFLWAQMYHGAMKHVAAVRRALAVRTIFNMAGPLANPAQNKIALMGVFDDAWRTTMAQTFKRLGGKKIWVVHGDGYDEIVSHAPTQVTVLHEDGTLTEKCIEPSALGIKNSVSSDLGGGSGDDNARLMENVLQGKNSSLASAVALNGAAMAVVSGRHDDLATAFDHAQQTLHEGTALQVLHRYCRMSHE